VDKEQARNLIKEIFENPFNKTRFTTFIKNLLNRIEEAQFTYQGQYVPDAYKPYISVLERIGKYSDGEHKIDILIIRLKKETSLERARTMQRNFVAWYLNGSRGGELKDAALVAFISPDEDDWRFSLVKMDYRFEQTSTGKTKVKEEFTPARRWSFLVGTNEKSHTAQSRLVPILSDDVNNPSLAQLEEAFNIETVTKEFFLKYRDLFIRIKEALDKVVRNDAKIKADFEAKGVNTVDFAKKLLGQIVFLYFLQKKGWFGAGRDADWGEGSKQFLRELFEKKHGSYNNFFNDILEPLFYEALRNDRSHDDDYYSRFNCKIPFLNGGLFDPIGNYDWVHNDICLPDSLFSNKNKTKEGDIGDGILDTFDRYNFTVKEDEPLEKEVAIDPEMLGKVFENLLEVKDRKSKGTYYTPREIVHYMCQESLINYLDTALNTQNTLYSHSEEAERPKNLNPDNTGEILRCAQNDSLISQMAFSYKPTVPREDIEEFIRKGEATIQNDLRVVREGRETRDYSYRLPESIRQNAERIDEALESIKICDPAVGSGAFPVGMMQEIVKAREVLTPHITDAHFTKDHERTAYNFKRHCIQESLYGVDIDPSAVDIAKLRLWLSLVVDEEDYETIKPLPNLEYKIVCGNSLLGVKKDLLNYKLFTELEALKPQYFEETNPRKKNQLKQKIESVIKQITKNDEHFDFEVYFSEVFHKKGGFDVVIANPPYVFGGSKKISNNEKNIYKKNYYSGTRKINLFSIFIEKGSCLLKEKGFLTFIVPNTLLRVTSYNNIREYLYKNTSLVEIVDLDVGVFEDVTASTIIISLQKKIPRSDNAVSIKRGLAPDPNFIKQRDFGNKGFIFDIFSNSIDRVLIGKLEVDSVKLISLARMIRFGVVISENINQVVGKRKLNEDWKPFLEGNEIGSYYIHYTGRYLFYKKDLLHRSRTPDVFETKKIMIQRITGGARPVKATYDDRNFYNKESIINLILNNNKEDDYKYILALLNSTLINWFYKTRFTNESKLTVNLSKEYLGQIPIKETSLSEKDLLANVVDKILSITKDDDYLHNPQKQAKVKEYERHIDRIVYELYGLTPEEIAIVEGNKD